MVHPFTALSSYDFTHLVDHLSSAGRVHDVHRLLSMETGEGKNAWYTALEENNLFRVYATDLQRVLDATLAIPTQQKKVVDLDRSTSLSTRYALMLASVNSLSLQVPPPILKALVKERIWTVEKGIDLARQVPGALERVQALLSLYDTVFPMVQEELSKEVIEIARSQASLYEQIKILIEIALHSNESLRDAAIDAVLQSVQEMNEFTLASLANLLPVLDERYNEAILKVAWQAVWQLLTGSFDPDVDLGTNPMSFTYLSAEEFASFLPYITVDQVDELLESLPRFENTTDRDRMMAMLAAHLAELGDSERALYQANTISDPDIQSTALAGIAIHQLPDERASTIKQVLATIWHIPETDQPEKAEVYAHWCLALAQLGLLREASIVIRKVTDGNLIDLRLVNVIHRLVEKGDFDAAEYFLSYLHASREEMQAIIAAARVRSGDLRKGLALISEIQQPIWRLASMSEVKPFLPLEEQQSICEVNVDGYFAIGDEAALKTSRQAFSAYIEGTGLANRIAWNADSLDALTGKEAGTILVSIEPEQHASEALEAIAQARQDLEEGIDFIADFNFLDQIAKHLSETPEELQSSLIEEGLEVLNHGTIGILGFSAFEKIVERLPAERLEEALEIARRLGEGAGFGMADEPIAAVAIRYTRLGMLNWASLLAHEMSDSIFKARALVELATDGAVNNQRWLIDEIKQMDDAGNKMNALEGMFPYLSPDFKRQAVQEMLELWKSPLSSVDGILPRTVSVAGEWLPAEKTLEAFEVIISDNYQREENLKKIAPALAALPPEFLFPAWKAALDRMTGYTREAILGSFVVLAPVIASLGGTAAIHETIQAVDDAGRWWP